MAIKTAVTKEDLLHCKQPVLQFRTHLDPDTYLDTMQEVIEGGFILDFITDNTGKAAGIIGYRFINMLRTGKTIYIDDLFVLPEYRGKGYASQLLGHVREVATTHAVKQVHLDSGYQLHPAHRLYLNHGFILNCLHFAYAV
ncbi:Acetyltransferase (GNAT) family protein [Chitinophaga sp. YR627]|uniref:GNAT family N-acetyltransferase n=1 Tax=Chitinophaga sp. YR627 TaxID=1881041 RepID=UPI0008EFE7D6|nr:GNAT family N-acetyltransferase [Chitinophaga sp. YR627]SFO76211.1 Acetyltransferase (GNAT) family protein [Chitinophaga sp. YR627]